MSKKFEECEFEIEPIGAGGRGRIWAELEEIGGDEPGTIIGTDQSFEVTVYWKLPKEVIAHTCGKFCVALHAESIGAGEEKTIGEADVEDDAHDEHGVYKHKFTIERGTLEAGRCGRVWQFAVTLVSLDKNGDPGHLAGYCKDLCVLFFRQPPHGG